MERNIFSKYDFMFSINKMHESKKYSQIFIAGKNRKVLRKEDNTVYYIEKGKEIDVSFMFKKGDKLVLKKKYSGGDDEEGSNKGSNEGSNEGTNKIYEDNIISYIRTKYNKYQRKEYEINSFIRDIENNKFKHFIPSYDNLTTEQLITHIQNNQKIEESEKNELLNFLRDLKIQEDLRIEILLKDYNLKLDNLKLELANLELANLELMNEKYSRIYSFVSEFEKIEERLINNNKEIYTKLKKLKKLKQINKLYFNSEENRATFVNAIKEILKIKEEEEQQHTGGKYKPKKDLKTFLYKLKKLIKEFE